MQLVQVVVVVYVLETYGLCGKEVERVGRLAIEVCGGRKGIYKDRFTTLYAIPQAMENLVSRWMLEVPW